MTIDFKVYNNIFYSRDNEANNMLQLGYLVDSVNIDYTKGTLYCSLDCNLKDVNYVYLETKTFESITILKEFETSGLSKLNPLDELYMTMCHNYLSEIKLPKEFKLRGYKMLTTRDKFYAKLKKYNLIIDNFSTERFCRLMNV